MEKRLNKKTYDKTYVTMRKLRSCSTGVFLCFYLLQPFDTRYTIDASAGTLKISSVQLADDGNYACVVNTTGHPPIASSNGRLYVESMLF